MTTTPTMTKEEIEDVLGRKFRRMMLDEQDKHLPKMTIAVQQLALQLEGEYVTVFAGNYLSAKEFTDRLRKKLRFIDRSDRMAGLRLTDLVMLEGTLSKFPFLQMREEILAYARDTRIWHIYEW